MQKDNCLAHLIKYQSFIFHFHSHLHNWCCNTVQVISWYCDDNTTAGKLSHCKYIALKTKKRQIWKPCHDKATSVCTPTWWLTHWVLFYGQLGLACRWRSNQFYLPFPTQSIWCSLQVVSAHLFLSIMVLSCTIFCDFPWKSATHLTEWF